MKEGSRGPERSVRRQPERKETGEHREKEKTHLKRKLALATTMLAGAAGFFLSTAEVNADAKSGHESKPRVGAELTPQQEQQRQVARTKLLLTARMLENMPVAESPEAPDTKEADLEELRATVANIQLSAEDVRGALRRDPKKYSSLFSQLPNPADGTRRFDELSGQLQVEKIDDAMYIELAGDSGFEVTVIAEINSVNEPVLEISSTGVTSRWSLTVPLSTLQGRYGDQDGFAPMAADWLENIIAQEVADYVINEVATEQVREEPVQAEEVEEEVQGDTDELEGSEVMDGDTGVYEEEAE